MMEEQKGCPSGGDSRLGTREAFNESMTLSIDGSLADEVSLKTVPTTPVQYQKKGSFQKHFRIGQCPRIGPLGRWMEMEKM